MWTLCNADGVEASPGARTRGIIGDPANPGGTDSPASRKNGKHVLKIGRLTETTLSQSFHPGRHVRPKKKAELEQVEGPGAPARHILAKDEVVVGRSREADVQIESEMMSRKHMLVRRVGPEFEYEDLDSKFGVYLNSVKAFAAVLRDGDVLQLGKVVFIFHEGG